MQKKKKLNEDIVSINCDDTDDNYDEFNDFMFEHTERQKTKLASEIIQKGELFLEEIDHRNKIKEEEKKPLIKYILKKSNKYIERYLLDLDFNDVVVIYNEIKYENRSFFRKILDFFGN